MWSELLDIGDFGVPPQECYEYKIVMGGWFGLIRRDGNFDGI